LHIYNYYDLNLIWQLPENLPNGMLPNSKFLAVMVESRVMDFHIA